MLYIEVDGVPVQEESAAVWEDFRKGDKGIVDRTDVDGLLVSTVFLGIDHNFSGTGPPLVYETMVFGNASSFDEWEVHRYCTRAEALAGHNKVVVDLRMGIIDVGESGTLE